MRSVLLMCKLGRQKGMLMPVKDCTKGGKPGKKWGNAGTCYVGPTAKEYAVRQGRVVKAAQARKKMG